MAIKKRQGISSKKHDSLSHPRLKIQVVLWNVVILYFRIFFGVMFCMSKDAFEKIGGKMN